MTAKFQSLGDDVDLARYHSRRTKSDSKIGERFRLEAFYG